MVQAIVKQAQSTIEQGNRGPEISRRSAGVEAVFGLVDDFPQAWVGTNTG
jgi:hypothetical protein